MSKKIVNKSWGYEVWFANVDEKDARYCGKKLFVEFDCWSSKGAYHHHEQKDETFFVVEGYLHLDYVTHLNNFKTVTLGCGDSFRIKPYIKHRFTAATGKGCHFIEASTPHYDTDSYRSRWDKKREVWVAV
jgi:mannose-6-phosphate isomerase-like protein (cupin superfamily)